MDATLTQGTPVDEDFARRVLAVLQDFAPKQGQLVPFAGGTPLPEGYELYLSDEAIPSGIVALDVGGSPLLAATDLATVSDGMMVKDGKFGCIFYLAASSAHEGLYAYDLVRADGTVTSRAYGSTPLANWPMKKCMPAGAPTSFGYVLLGGASVATDAYAARCTLAYDDGTASWSLIGSAPAGYGGGIAGTRADGVVWWVPAGRVTGPDNVFVPNTDVWIFWSPSTGQFTLESRPFAPLPVGVLNASQRGTWPAVDLPSGKKLIPFATGWVIVDPVAMTFTRHSGGGYVGSTSPAWLLPTSTGALQPRPNSGLAYAYTEATNSWRTLGAAKVSRFPAGGATTLYGLAVPGIGAGTLDFAPMPGTTASSGIRHLYPAGAVASVYWARKL